MNEQTIKRYCIKKLSQILFECVDCAGDRAETDWLTAEKFINEHPSVIKKIIDSPVMNLVFRKKIDVSYEEFEKDYGRYIWNNCYQIIKQNLPYPYGRIHFN